MKRILSLDGGGIRGVFSLQIAARVEHLFRRAYGRPDLVLADVVDLFAGTSTGAIIAAFLAWGYPVAEIEHLYLTHSRQMFARQVAGPVLQGPVLPGRAGGRLLPATASASPTARRPRWGRPSLRKPAPGRDGQRHHRVALARVQQPGWPSTTSGPTPTATWTCPLWQLLRGSTAAPTYFAARADQARAQRESLFVDGGVTPYNNPALLAMLMATLPCYHLKWPTGPGHCLHLTSIGTGGQKAHYLKTLATKVYLWNTPGYVIRGLMGTVGVNQDLLCRVIGRCLHGSKLDSELECLAERDGVAAAGGRAEVQLLPGTTWSWTRPRPPAAGR